MYHELRKRGTGLSTGSWHISLVQSGQPTVEYLLIRQSWDVLQHSLRNSLRTRGGQYGNLDDKHCSRGKPGRPGDVRAAAAAARTERRGERFGGRPGQRV